MRSLAAEGLARLKNSLDQTFAENAGNLGATVFRRVSIESHSSSSCFRRILEHPAVDFLIMLSIAQMGFSLDYQFGKWTTVWMVSETFVAIVFFVEMMMRMSIDGWSFFWSWLNVIDFSVAWLSVVDVLFAYYVRTTHVMPLEVFKILRLARLMRIAKLLRRFPAFRIILETLFASMRAMLWLMFFMFATMYICSFVAVLLVGTKDAGYPGYDTSVDTIRQADLNSFNNYRYFGTIRRSMITLFNMAMLSDEMVSVVRATNEIQIWASLFFVMYTLVITLCLLNTIVGVIVEKTVSVYTEDDAGTKAAKRKQMQAIDRLANLMFELDEDGTGDLSVSELVSGATKKNDLRELLRQIDLPVGFTIEELFDILDVDGSGIISRSEFIGGLFRMVFSNTFQRDCLTRLGEAQMRRYMDGVKMQILSEMRAMQNSLQAQIQNIIVQPEPSENPVVSSRKASSHPNVGFSPERDTFTGSRDSHLSADRHARRTAYVADCGLMPEFAEFFQPPVPSVSVPAGNQDMDKVSAGKTVVDSSNPVTDFAPNQARSTRVTVSSKPDEKQLQRIEQTQQDNERSSGVSLQVHNDLTVRPVLRTNADPKNPSWSPSFFRNLGDQPCFLCAAPVSEGRRHKQPRSKSRP